jgi:hypothetical protein
MKHNTDNTPIPESCLASVSKSVTAIKIGEHQPVDCENCKSKEGYQYSDFMKLHYTTFHDKEGKQEGGQYSEGASFQNKGITPYCCNCGKKLKFKLIREDLETLEAKKHPKGSYFV